ncbi:MAG: NAD(P)-binding domain-containing protein, partial [Cyanobacteria bacterium J06642_11]
MPGKLGIIGGGVMGEALLSCLLSRGLYEPESVLVADLSHGRRQLLTEQYGVGTTHSNREVIDQSNIIVLAIKPQVFDAVARDFSGIVASDPPLVLSIL